MSGASCSSVAAVAAVVAVAVVAAVVADIGRGSTIRLSAGLGTALNWPLKRLSLDRR